MVVTQDYSGSLLITGLLSKWGMENDAETSREQCCPLLCCYFVWQ